MLYKLRSNPTRPCPCHTWICSVWNFAPVFITLARSNLSTITPCSVLDVRTSDLRLRTFRPFGLKLHRLRCFGRPVYIWLSHKPPCTRCGIDQRRVDVSISKVSCNEMCPSVRRSVGLSPCFLSGCTDVLFCNAELERFFDLPRLYTTVLYTCTVISN